MEMRPEEELKSAAVKVAAPFVLPSAAASWMLTLPAAYIRGDEKVVVAVQVGTPETSAKTWPLVPAEVVAIAPVPFPRRRVFAVKAVRPVPPEGTPIVVEADTAPAVP